MSKVQNPLIGRAKGQAGGMVFTTLNGQNVMKAKPYSYRDQNTVVQQANRAIMLVIVMLASSLKNVARSLFSSQPTDMPAFSKLIQQLQAGVSRASLPYLLTLPGLNIGSGTCTPEILEINYSSSTGQSDISLEFGDTPVDWEPANKNLIIINKSTNLLIGVYECTGTFQSGSLQASLPTGLTASNLVAILDLRDASSVSNPQTAIKTITQVVI